MHNLLQRLLEKRKITDITQLDEDEKVEYDRWEAILSEGEITVAKIKQFCESQLGIIEIQMKNLDNSSQKNERLILNFNIYKAIVNIINSPAVERTSLEKYLTQLLK